MASLFVMVGFAMVAWLTAAVALYLCGKWLRFRRTGVARALLVSCCWMIVGVAALSVPASLAPSSPSRAFVLLALPLAILIIEIAVLFLFMAQNFLKSLAGWGISLMPRIFIAVMGLLLLRPYVVQAYLVTTQGMAPTILAESAKEICPRCSGPVYIATEGLLPLPLRLSQPDEAHGICINCREELTVKRSTLHADVSADRFFVCKILKPARWDMVMYRRTFKNPSGPVSELYLKRIVGLPGEQIAISEDGIVLVGGKPLTPPPGVPDRFRWPAPEMRAPDTLKPGEQVTLGSDECFVLGDLAERSSDSRYTGPVKMVDVTGVVDFIYLPLSRARILR